MPYAGVSGMVMTAQGGGTAIQDIGGMGVQITQTTLPSSPMHADLDDVVMAESGRASIRSGHRSRTSRRHARSKNSSSSALSSASSSDDERHHRRRVSKRHDRSSKRSSRKRRSPSRSIKSERSSYSGRSARSATSGASQVALNAFRTTQEALSRMESKQNESMRQTFQAIQTLATQTAAQEERLRRDLGSAMKDAQVPTVQVPAPVTQQAATPEYVEAARMEAAQVAREAAHADFEARLQQFQAGVEAEKATWASGLQETLNAFQQKMQIMEEARRRDHMTILKLQTVPGTSSRNVPATSSNPKAESYPQSATSIGSVPDLTTAPSKSSGAPWDMRLIGRKLQWRQRRAIFLQLIQGFLWNQAGAANQD